MTDLAMSDYPPPTHGDFVHRSLVPITTAGMLRKQQSDSACRNVIARLKQGEKEASSLSEERLLIRTTYGDEQIVLIEAL